MECPKCQFEQADTNLECQKCGIIFEKVRKLERPELQKQPRAADEPEVEFIESHFVKDLFFHVEPIINPLYFGGRALLFLIILIWGWQFIFCTVESNYVGKSFWHLVNLPFHEAGHIIFRPFGRLMTSLGGSLGQLLMPLACLVTFLLVTRDTFAGSVSLWWFGQNFMDLAPYINDARALKLPLLGGNTGRTAPYGFHDWEFILKESGLIRYTKTIAKASHTIGIIIILIAFAWGGYLLFKQYKNLDR
ncbi:zinc ribbon domain-containing protein [Thermodesulfobacteriota bacterium]